MGIIPLKDTKLDENATEEEDDDFEETVSKRPGSRGEIDPNKLLDESMKKELDELLNPKK